ncbi:MAG TPA: SRPBCC family protein [Propionibacteriaceae bacterium]|nr:SRPBCC family protein [Propionibacteriaceae bacterium]
MSVRLRTALEVRASAPQVWARLTDWAGQRDWIPLTTVTVLTAHAAGLGVRASALSGFQVGRVPVGLLDRFIVTGWTPPTGREAGSLEVLHLGPCFTGPGIFEVEPTGVDISRVICTEVFELPGGRPVEAATRLLLPTMRVLLRSSLRKLGRLLEEESA